MDKIESRYQNSPLETAGMDTATLRQNFLIESLMKEDQFSFLYSHYDRCVIGSAVPLSQELNLSSYENLKSDFFLERRELGVINVGGQGEIKIDGQVFDIGNLDALYVGMGSKAVAFSSKSADDPAKYFLYSAPAHQAYPTALIKKENASPVELGQQETANVRTIYKYIHAQGQQSCQLVMGVTVLKTGSIWNTMPAHVHDRRMEAYL
jgi:4-deoxy-L-threo-5-hexosulose-uronate ketol-isomerase